MSVGDINNCRQHESLQDEIYTTTNNIPDSRAESFFNPNLADIKSIADVRRAISLL
jgi:hypothetical protein